MPNFSEKRKKSCEGPTPSAKLFRFSEKFAAHDFLLSGPGFFLSA
jgi:hypothetical protein